MLHQPPNPATSLTRSARHTAPFPAMARAAELQDIGAQPTGLPGTGRPDTGTADTEAGYLLIGLVVAIFLIALFLTIAAPTVAKQMERDRELESEHRAQQYVRAIQNYYVKFNRYPTTVDQLLSQNNQHFLRQQYKDPLTGGDYRLIHLGEAKTTVKGFFGEELEGVPQGGNLGSLSSSASDTSTTHTFGSSGASGNGLGGNSAGGSSSGAGSGSSFGSGSGFGPGSGSGFGSASGLGGGSSLGSGSGLGSSSGSSPGSGGLASGNSAGASGSVGAAGSGTDAGSTLGGTSATQFQGSKGAIVGVGSDKAGAALVEWNGSANIEDWEFLFDPRVLAIKQQVSLQGGSPAQNGSGSFGSVNGNTNGLGSNTPSSFGTGFGGNSTTSPSGSNFGSGQGSGPQGVTSPSAPVTPQN